MSTFPYRKFPNQKYPDKAKRPLRLRTEEALRLKCLDQIY